MNLITHLCANSTVPEALEREVIWAPSRRGIDLDCSRLHGIADDDGLVNVLREDAALRGKHTVYLNRRLSKGLNASI